MNKKILSLVLVLTLVLGSFSFAFADTKVSSDVVGTDYEDAVTRLNKLSILTGYPDGSFKPENTITRAEFSAAVARARGLEAASQNSKGDTPFTDVTANHWASGYVNQASKLGLVNGMGNGIFAPESQITYEQAVTLVVRALGYEEKAKTQGGYPYGHLSVASETGLLKDVKSGTQGTPATRGLVAQLLDNALDIEKMIQTGYGDQAKWVVSGTEGTVKQYLFDDLGLKRLEKATITEADKDKNKVVVKVEDRNSSDYNKGKTLKVEKNFNFAGLEGLRVTVWYNDKNDELIDVKVENDFQVKFDGFEVTKEATKSRDAEIKLLTEDKKYDVADDAVIKIDGEKIDASELELDEKEYNFAKIILNDYNNVSWIDAYSLDGPIVVDKVEKDVLKGYDDESLDDIDDYTIIKDGKQILSDDLSKKDVLLYNSKEEYAVVVTNTKQGEVERVYKDGFRFDGEIYQYDNDYGTIKYLSGDSLEEVDADVMDEMRDNGKITVYFSFDDKVVFIDGKAEEVSGNYAMVKETSSESFKNRGEDYYKLDVLNSEGKVLEFDIKAKDIKDTSEDFLKSEAEWKDTIVEKNIIKLSLDANNKPTKVEKTSETRLPKEITGDNKVRLKSDYAAGYKLQSKTQIFWRDGENEVKNYETFTWDQADKYFTEIQKGWVYADDQGRAVAIFAEETDNDGDTNAVVGILRDVQERKGKERYEFEIEVNGNKPDIYEGKKDAFKDYTLSELRDEVNEVVVLRVGDKDKEVKRILIGNDVEKSAPVTVKSATNSKLVDTNNNEYTIVGKYYDDRSTERKDIAARNVIGEEVILYFEPGSDTHVQVVILNGKGNSGGNTKTDVLQFAYKKGSLIYVTINDRDYEYGGSQELTDLQALSGKEVKFSVRNGVIVSVEEKNPTTTEPETPDPIDTTNLEAEIANAKEAKADVEISADGTDIEVGKKWVTQDVKEALDAAILKAEEALESATTNEEVTAAINALRSAIETYEAEIADGTM
ncbi:S-layer domain-containing protein [Gottschalkia acidurici 9a]|uniref:S-layer domain-containing protein n=1 Tax=Gottschalkia acidurici (strain ATCC 7906 / DSM 604 / BCRC 14475 / CIP 104303 / KCTC 5404 / NCIMB 10678 / 9a) TaxID=1128398 RepID=K0AWX9_GOTA9|nr:S-layer homology domain-containing protein [Gottschalkia acidurici]AFS77250.1 S-layer domain-containing protein [Gottschalkia acidurici 9a]